jgi:hypothetical protein
MTAANLIGTPYSWGGGGVNGPSRGMNQGSNTVGFDCSSFVQYVFAKQGINLPRTTYDQIKHGRAINPLQAQPGDLLFFGNHGVPHHVGIYMGNGKMIEAPHTGASIRISGVNLNGVMACRRVLQDGAGSAINFGGYVGGGNSTVAGGGPTSAGISGAPGTVISGTAIGTTVGQNAPMTANAGASAAGAGMATTSSNGNVIINVTVPASTSPNAAAETAKTIQTAVAKGMNVKSEAKK